MEENKSPKKNTKTLVALVGVLLLCCCVLAAVAGAVYFFVLGDDSSDISGEAKGTENYQEYAGDDFKFKYPQNWMFNEDFLRVYDPSNEDLNSVQFSFNNVSDVQDDGFNVNDISEGKCDSLNSFVDQIVGGSSDISNTNITSVEINGIKGCAVTLDGEQDSKKISGALYFLVNSSKDKLAFITASEEGDSFDTAANIVKTFEFVE
ncbi:MAG: hypothetical protein KatS3mg085_492 [Candidatus Dojkabacteria bacterium]|nr:MAG: hypothetical protein KatS3mg085_492 [Candidatus Dojkabacteria bacterium]